MGPWTMRSHPPIDRTEIHPKILNLKLEAGIGQNVERQTCVVCKKKNAYTCLVARELMIQLANDIWAQVMRSLAGLTHNDLF